MKVLVIGAGVGGPCAALALQRRGMEAHVFEARSPVEDSTGLFFGIAANGMRVLKELEVLETVIETESIPTPHMVFSSSTGKRLGMVSSGYVDSHPSFTLMRGALQSALVEECTRRGVPVAFQKRLATVSETNDSVKVVFQDGSTAEGDIVVGADGIWSKVRSGMYPNPIRPTFTGLLNLGGRVADSQLASTDGEMHMIWGKRAFFGYTVQSDGTAWWFANVARHEEPCRNELEEYSVADWKHELLDLFKLDRHFISRLIECTPEIGAYPIHDMPSLPTWHSRRIVLLGDAAHAVSPSAGQGASLAMEDALTLANALSTFPDPNTAFEKYEATRRPRTEKIIAVGRRRGEYKAPTNPVSLFLRDLLMPLAFKMFATEKSMSWMLNYQVPSSEELIDIS